MYIYAIYLLYRKINVKLISVSGFIQKLCYTIFRWRPKIHNAVFFAVASIPSEHNTVTGSARGFFDNRRTLAAAASRRKTPAVAALFSPPVRGNSLH
jgi:hypothetical protein